MLTGDKVQHRGNKSCRQLNDAAKDGHEDIDKIVGDRDDARDYWISITFICRKARRTLCQMTCKFQQLDSEGKRLTMLDIRETTDEMIDDIFFFFVLFRAGRCE